MEKQIKLDYFYGNEADRFCFYRIPKVLFTKAFFDGLSTDAKVLYGLMLDTMSSSRTNRWIDTENRVFIQFSIQRAMAYLGCGKAKAVNLFAELDSEKGIGLIERINRGQGKADIIYVKSFEIPQEAEDNARIMHLKKRQQNLPFGPMVQRADREEEYSSGPVDQNLEPETSFRTVPYKNAALAREVSSRQMGHKTDSREDVASEQVTGKSDFSRPKDTDNEVVRKSDHYDAKSMHFQGKVVRKTNQSENETGLKIELPEVGFSYPNKNNYINTIRDTSEGSNISPSVLSLPEDPQMNDGRKDRKDALIHQIRAQIRYDDLMKLNYYQLHRELVDGIINIIAVTIIYPKPSGTEWINGREISYLELKDRFLTIDSDKLEYLVHNLQESYTKVRNKRSYLLTAIYNVWDEIDFGYGAQVRYELFGGGR